jgi:hypothetical protein
LQANTITADEIAANAVTANELAANLVLVNNVIRSNSYDGTIAANNVITSSGTTGWAITSAGQAVFANAVIRGNVTANAGTIGGWNVDSDSLYSGTKSSNGNYATSGITIGSSGFISAKEFRLDADGNAHFKGDLNGASIVGVTGRFTGSVTVDGDLTAGNTTIYANGQITNGGYTLSATGALTATSGSIGGSVTIGGTAASTVVNSAANAITASQVQNNLGGAGITTITGGTISTGIISSVGGARTINLDTGAISFGNFTVSAAGAAVFAGSITGSTITGSTVSTTDGTDGILISSDGYLTGTGGSGVRIKNVGGETGVKIFGNVIFSPRVATNEIDSFDGGDFMRVGRVSSTGGYLVKVSQALYNVTSNLTKRNVAVTSGDILVTTDLSSIRYKTNVNKLNIDYKKILKLEPVSFLYKKEFLLEDDDESIIQHGLIAEQVEESGLKELVQYDEQNRPDGVDYLKLPIYLLLVCKEQQLKIEELEARIQTLEGV